KVIKSFTPSGAKPLLVSGVTPDKESWLITMTDELLRTKGDPPRRFPFFDVPVPALENGFLVFRAKMRCASLKSTGAYLEIEYQLPGDPNPTRKNSPGCFGDFDWATDECRLPVDAKKAPDRVKLNLIINGRGKIWIKEAELLHVPAPAEAAWVQLFNGKDMKGWHVSERHAPGSWKVEGGIL